MEVRKIIVFFIKLSLFMVKKKKAMQNGGQLNLVATNYDDYLKEMNVKEIPSWVDKSCNYIVKDLSKKGFWGCETHGFALDSTIKQSCFSNIRVICGAVEMYNLDHENSPMKSLNIIFFTEPNPYFSLQLLFFEVEKEKYLKYKFWQQVFYSILYSVSHFITLGKNHEKIVSCFSCILFNRFRILLRFWI